MTFFDIDKGHGVPSFAAHMDNRLAFRNLRWKEVDPPGGVTLQGV